MMQHEIDRESLTDQPNLGPLCAHRQFVSAGVSWKGPRCNGND
jgi:hypothetical protein